MNAERYFGVALDGSPSSKYAMKWAIESVLKEPDHLILVVVHKEVLEGGQVHLWGKAGSPLVPYESLIDPSIQKAYQLKWDEELLHCLEEAVTVKKLTVVAKVYWGDAKEKICDVVVEIPLDGLVMGSRGFGTFKRTLLGSVSNYVVNNVPCPVTVVKLPGPTWVSKEAFKQNLVCLQKVKEDKRFSVPVHSVVIYMEMKQKSWTFYLTQSLPHLWAKFQGLPQLVVHLSGDEGAIVHFLFCKGTPTVSRCDTICVI